MKTLALTIAHALRNKFANWSDCLRHAWKLAKLKFAMLRGVVEFQYRKIDGSIRNAIGTMKSDLFSYEYKGQKSNYGVMPYYDLEAGQFRCFKLENLI